MAVDQFQPQGWSDYVTTQAEQDRLDAIHAMPCIACQLDNQQQPNRTEAHHLVDKGYRKHSGGHMATIPLCSWHHRGEPAFDVNASEMACAFGPSKAREGKKFTARYGTDRELLAKVDERLRRAA